MSGRTWHFAEGGGLSHEARVSVAENVMERAGHTGREHHVPFVHWGDGPRTVPPEHRDVHDFVHRVLISEGMRPDFARHIRVQPKDWDARGHQAVTDGLNKIGLGGEHTTDMTLLHECAHILHGTSEGEGHGPDFIRTLHGLYERHLGPDAAATFRRVVEPQ